MTVPSGTTRQISSICGFVTATGGFVEQDKADPTAPGVSVVGHLTGQAAVVFSSKFDFHACVTFSI